MSADATGGGGFIEEVHDDPYNNFFQSSQQSLPSASPGSRLPNLFSARRLWKRISRRHPPPVSEGKVSERESEQGVNVDDRGSGNDPLSDRKDKGKQRDDGFILSSC
ncbi:hypothetical protein EV702DRAFT_1042877 [Suillus placidus]|uniref:Uncharacterized protein n=1 Tax=Suillus placidus TaxID=48579 RepID=A0A9P7A1M8_9AGAM|nr:hypothetical protein EV702DRAFT_1042877 [Suillus placidus]